MSKAQNKIESNLPLDSNRDKIIQIILQELTFLNECFNKAIDINVKNLIKEGVQKLENLLKITGMDEADMSLPEYQNIVQFIHSVLHQITQHITQGGVSK